MVLGLCSFFVVGFRALVPIKSSGFLTPAMNNYFYRRLQNSVEGLGFRA